MEQNSPGDLDEVKKQTALLEARKGKIEAERALIEAEKALDQRKDPATQQMNDLQRAKSLADAQKSVVDSQKALEAAQAASGRKLTELQAEKSLADAQKALAEAEVQASLARYVGDVKAGPYSGAVSMKDKAGTEEALLLGACAVKEGAGKIADAVRNKAKEHGISKFYLFGAKECPGFQRMLAFRFRVELTKRSFEAVGIMEPAGIEEMVTAGAVSAGLDAFSKLVGFLKTDYELGGIDVKLDESMLMFSVAGKLTDKEVHMPLMYEPAVQADAMAALTKEMAGLTRLRIQAADEAARSKNLAADAEKKAADPQNAASRDELLESAAFHKSRLDRLAAVIALYDSFAGSLTTPDANTGSTPYALLAQESAIYAALKENGAAMLLLKLENSGGGYLLKKNLLTGIYRMPLYHMGGASVSYLLLNGPDGRVIGGDVYPIHGGFVRTDKIRDVLKKKKR